MHYIFKLRQTILVICLSIVFHAQADDHMQADQGLISLKSAHSVKQTADKLEKLLNSKGMTVFARINHAQGAQKVGLNLRPTELVIFGNPKVGTPLMQCQQTVAIDLPQKALIWQDEKGATWLSYNDPKIIAKEHGLTGCSKTLNKITKALNLFASKAVEE